jgi:type VI secretion system secreted protein VgrG
MDKNDLLEKIDNNAHLKIGNNHNEEIGTDHNLKIGGKQAISITGARTMSVDGNKYTKVSGNIAEEAGGTVEIKGMSVVVEGMTQVSLKVGGNFVDINPGGVFIMGTMVMINTGGAPGVAAPAVTIPPAPPEPPAEADDAEPGKKVQLEKQSIERKRKKPGKEEKKSWIELKLVDEENNPVPGQGYEVVEGDGTTHTGTLNENGKAHVKLKNPGSCQVSFPDLDQGAWEDA